MELPGPGPDLDAFAQLCLDTLVARNRTNRQQWGIDEASPWQLDRERNELQFQTRGGRIVVRPQIIGTIDLSSGRWLWAWGNSSVDAPLRDAAENLRAYGERWKLLPLTTASWPASEEDAWIMTAFAVHLFNAEGAYRAVAGDLRIFMTYDHPYAAADS